MRPSVITLALGTAGVVLLAACGGSTSPYGGGGGGGGGGSGCTPTATQLCMMNTAFDPATKTVSVGTSLTWMNGDPFGHTTTSNAANPAGCPTWNDPVNAGQTSAGVVFGTGSVTCAYHCTIHASMQASVTVQ